MLEAEVLTVEKRRYQSPRTGATGWRWYFDHPACPEWGFTRKKDALQAFYTATCPVCKGEGGVMDYDPCGDYQKVMCVCRGRYA